MTDEKHKTFWTTLPGILAGVASLLTAVVALLTFTLSNCRHSSEESGPKLQNISQCQEITGSWTWFTGGEVKILADGGLEWRQNPASPTPTVIGRWTCNSSKPRDFMLAWQLGVTETVNLSPDRNSLAGINTLGVRISGTRRS